MREQFRNDVMEMLGMRLGERYSTAPRDVKGGSGPVRHGIRIHRKGDAEATVVCLEEAILHCIAEGRPPEELPKAILQTYLQEEASRDIARGLYSPGQLEGMVRIEAVNYRANSAGLAGRPHRRFLDLAAAYYLDMEEATGIKYAIARVTGRVAGSWGIPEEELYRLGMERLLAEDGCQAMEATGVVRELMEEGPDGMKEAFEEAVRKAGKKAEVYVITSPGQRFGAAGLLNTAFLQEMAEEKGCSLIIYPSSVHEVIAVPYRDGDGLMGTEDVQEINEALVPRSEWLSNSVYLYDMSHKRLTIFREGRPLKW